MLLALFGGCAQPGTEPGTGKRGAIHVLICGDPGLGKSQLLQVSWQHAAHRHVGQVCGAISPTCLSAWLRCLWGSRCLCLPVAGDFAAWVLACAMSGFDSSQHKPSAAPG